MKLIITWLALLVTLSAASPAYANGVTELSLEERIARSDLIVTGSVLSVHKERDGLIELAKVRVTSVLKGLPEEVIEIIIFSGISEFALDCCSIGGSYFFMVQKNPKDGRYSSVNGPYGAYELP